MLTRDRGTFSIRSNSTKHYKNPKSGLSLPRHLQNNYDHTYGRNEPWFKGGDISEVINHSYMKEYMQEKIRKRALQNIKIKEAVPRDWKTKTYDLRTEKIINSYNQQERARQREEDIQRKNKPHDLFPGIESSHSGTRLSFPASTRNSKSVTSKTAKVSKDQILEEIHMMRMKVADQVDNGEPRKINLPHLTKQEKEEIMDQYFQVKR